MRHIPIPLSNGLMTRSGLKTNFLRVSFYCKVIIRSCDIQGRLGIGFWVCSRKC